MKNNIIIGVLGLLAVPAIYVAWLVREVRDDARLAAQIVDTHQRYEETLTKQQVALLQLRAKMPTHADYVRQFYQLCLEINPGKATAYGKLVDQYDRMYWSQQR